MPTKRLPAASVSPSQFATRFFPSYEALIEARPDGVIICTENNKHRPLVEMAAARGVNVLCEKPIATTLADARAEVEACEKGGVLFMTAFPMRFSPPLLEVKARLEAGDLGPGVLLQRHQPGRAAHQTPPVVRRS